MGKAGRLSSEPEDEDTASKLRHAVVGGVETADDSTIFEILRWLPKRVHNEFEVVNILVRRQSGNVLKQKHIRTNVSDNAWQIAEKVPWIC